MIQSLLTLIVGIILALVGLVVMFKFGGLSNIKTITGLVVGIIFVIIGLVLALMGAGLMGYMT